MQTVKQYIKATDVTVLTVQFHFDVWGNEQDGYDVNNSRMLQSIAIPSFSTYQDTPIDIKANLHKAGYINDWGLNALVVTDIGDWYTVDYPDGEPMFTLYPEFDDHTTQSMKAVIQAMIGGA